MVTLSGGDLGGTEVSGDAWEIGDVVAFSGLLYRRTSDTQAVFEGVE